MAEADAALYRAKSAGRNRVVSLAERRRLRLVRRRCCAAQQRDEERRAHQRHDRSHRQLTRARDRPGHQIRRGQQRSSQHSRGWRDDAVIARAEQQPHGMRRDESDESHRSRAHHSDGSDRGAGDEHQRAPRVHIEPNAARAQSRRRRARSSGRASSIGESNSNQRSDARSRVGLGAQPRSPASQNTMLRTRDESATASNTLMSAPHALASTTPVSSRRAVPPPRASRYTARHRAERAEHSTGLHHDDRRTRQHREQRTDGRATGHAEHVRVRERIAEQRLQAAHPPRRAGRPHRMRRAGAAGALRAARCARASSPAPASALSAPFSAMPEVPMSSAAANTSNASASSAAIRRIEPAPNHTARDIA